MQLPLLTSATPATSSQVWRLLRQTAATMARTTAQEIILDGATVWVNLQLPDVHTANWAGEMWLPPGENAEAVIARVLAHFAQAGATCYRMEPAGQLWEPALEQAIQARGYRRDPGSLALRLERWRPQRAARNDLQILPGRAVLPALLALCREAVLEHSFATPPVAEQLVRRFENHMDETRLDVLAARDRGKLVGYLKLLTVGDAGVIDGLYVLQPYRNQAVATTLMHHALDLCARARHKQVLLEAVPGGKAAQWYERLGFVPCGVSQHYEI